MYALAILFSCPLLYSSSISVFLKHGGNEKKKEEKKSLAAYGMLPILLGSPDSPASSPSVDHLHIAVLNHIHGS
jgi:hypothetical protein